MDFFKNNLAVYIIVIFLAAVSSLSCNNNEIRSERYLVLYAFDAEGELLAQKMEQPDSLTILGRLVIVGKLSGKDIVLAESGMGMTNASMMTQKLIDLYEIKAVIFSGIAGGIDSTVQIGDITVCRKWATHDFVYHGAAGPQPSQIIAFDSQADSLSRFLYFPVDSLLYTNAVRLSRKSFDFEIIGDRVPLILCGGNGVSGNAFIDNYDKRIWLDLEFDAVVTDMETAAVAQVCAANNKPFIAFRSASDLAGGSGSSSADKQLEQFFKVAAVNSSKLVIEYLKSI